MKRYLCLIAATVMAINAMTTPARADVAAFENYTPGDPNTYDTTTLANISVDTLLFSGPYGFGSYGTATETLSVGFDTSAYVGYDQGITDGKLSVVLRVNEHNGPSNVNFALYKGSATYGGITLDDELILDGQFHEYVLEGFPQPYYQPGRFQIRITAQTTPAAQTETGTMSVDFATIVGAPGTTTVSKTGFANTTVNDDDGIPVFRLSATPLGVPEPATAALLALGAACTLTRRPRASA